MSINNWDRLGPIKVPIWLMMWLDTLLTILSLDIPILLFIIHKEMDKLSLQIRFLEPS
jgi:hypothetical protein